MTPKLKAKLAKLKAVAEAVQKFGPSEPYETAIARHIATFNPQTVLALLAALETMAEAMEAIRNAEHDNLCGEDSCSYMCSGLLSALSEVEEVLNGI